MLKTPVRPSPSTLSPTSHSTQDKPTLPSCSFSHFSSVKATLRTLQRVSERAAQARLASR
jgi:hypothetical protein